VQCVDLDAVLDEVTSDLKPRLDTAAASVRRDSLLPSVAGDARQLYQLLRNLVENSIKYRRPGIPLEIRVSGRFDDDGAEILVADNGQGFDPADAERIFGAFERANESENEGLGLGLALCRRIMERCGGRIVARGRPGHGAAFEIRFSRPPEDWDPESG
jgi:signal transduction histidine kinase